jgi:hypothetical protein
MYPNRLVKETLPRNRSMTTRLRDSLDKCLDRVLLDGDDIGQCLRDYPDIAEELEAPLRTALFLQAGITSVQPWSEYTSLAKQRFLSRISKA